MLTIHVEEIEVFNEETSEFSTIGGIDLHLEHSLVAISKWESKYKRPFLLKDTRTTEENLYYIQCMCLDENIPEYIYYILSNDNIRTIISYIEEKRTATTIYTYGGNKPKSSEEIITSELIYYWLISLNIPIEAQYWHLSRLLQLIQVFNAKNSDDKLSTEELYARQRAINEARRNK